MEQKEKLKVSDIQKSYGDNVVLRGVSLTANAGDVISIIGSSGSGKSTFLRCINMLEKPNQGTIALNGELLDQNRVRLVNWWPVTANNYSIFVVACAWYSNTLIYGNT